MASNANQDNSIVGQLSTAASNAAKTVGDNASWLANKISGETEEQQRKAAGEAVTSSNTSIGQKVDAAGSYVKHGANEASDKSKAEKDNQKAQYHSN